MTTTKILARDCTVEIETAVVDTFVEIGGLNSISFDRRKNRTDTGDFNSGGIEEHLPTETGKSVTAEGSYLTTLTTGVRDAGQARAELLSDLVGPAGMSRARVTDSEGDGFKGLASFDAGPTGGGKNDMHGWRCEITFSGPLTVV
jgi:hypothetical protein